MKNEDQHPNRKENTLSGLLGAFAGALVGSIPLMLFYNWGYFVGWLGVLISFCATLGYERLEGKRGKLKIVTIITVSIIGIALAQYLSLLGAMHQFLEGEGVIAVARRLNSMIIHNTAHLRGRLLNDLGIGLFFAILGLIGMMKFRHPHEKE